VQGVYVDGSTVYAATNSGLSKSTDGGTSSTSSTTGLGSKNVYGVYASGDTVYAATAAGLSFSTDGGTNFTYKTTTSGLGSNTVNGVYASGEPELADKPGALLRRLILAGGETLEARRRRTVDGRRHAIERTSGTLTGVYGPGYLDELRQDWPQ